MTDPGFLFDAGDVVLPSSELAVHWTSLGEAADCSCGALHRDPGRPPAEEQHRPQSAHRYPRPRPHRARNDPGAFWTIGDALKFLDPSPPRRTVSRWLLKIPPVGVRALPQGGPPARTYPARTIMEAHARWAGRGRS